MAEVSSADESYDGARGDQLARLLDVPRVVVYREVGSTMDVAHALAEEGAPGGTLVVADAQLSGRGRHGRRWESQAGRGVWLTLLERPLEVVAANVLSLRLGLRLAPVLDAYAVAPVQIKWPNDLMVHGAKLGGILVESRWQGARLSWTAIGVGINTSVAGVPTGGTALQATSSRVALLAELVPALRGAVAAEGPLTDREREQFADRDVARGRIARTPGRGRVAGIDTDGQLVIIGVHGEERFGSGSLILEDALA